MPTSTLLTAFSLAQHLSDFFYNLVFSNLFIIKAIFISISIIFLLLVVYFNTSLNISGEKMEHWFEVIGAEKLNKRKALKAWLQIKKRMAAGGQNNMKLAILEADRVLDEILKASGYRGDNMNERLNQLSGHNLLDEEAVFHAHKLRNKIVADPSYNLGKEEAEKAIAVYQSALVGLGLLETRGKDKVIEED